MFQLGADRCGVNLLVALMLGTLFVNSGNEGSRVLDNYNLLFAILLHHSMTTMMLTVLTCKLSSTGCFECNEFDDLTVPTQFPLKWASC